MEPTISIIAAIGKNRELGKDNKLLWHIPEDMKRFKELTHGHAVIMGRKTFESIGRPLPNRLNFIVSRDPNYTPNGVAIVCSSLEDALEKAKEREVNEIFIIGGGQIYKEALPLADKLYLTVVDAAFPDADTYFPEYDEFKKVTFEKEGSTKEYHYTFLELERA